MADFIPKIEFFKMISASLRQDLDPDLFVLDEPKYNNPNLNTVVKIRPVLGSRLYIERDMTYNRVDLDVIQILSVRKGTAVDLHGLLASINEEPLFQVNQRLSPIHDLVSIDGMIVAEDVYNVELPAFGFKKFVDIPMKAKPSSLFFTGSLVLRVSKA